MAPALKQQLEKLLHRREPSDAADKRSECQASSSSREMVKTQSRIRPAGSSSRYGPDGTPPRSEREPTSRTTAAAAAAATLIRGAPPTVRPVDDRREISAELRGMKLNGGRDVKDDNEPPQNIIPTPVVPARDASLDWQQHPPQSTARFHAKIATRLSELPSAPEGPPAQNFSHPRLPPDHPIHNSSTPIDLAAHGFQPHITSTTTTDITTTLAPAVIHEQVRVDTHEIITERIHRHIHNHDVFHRILPIIDIHVLPPRHFIQPPGSATRYEIPAAQAPGGIASSQLLQRVLQDAVDRDIARRYPPLRSGPRTFTAVDYGPGKHFSEKTCVHPPVLEKGGYESGQTLAFHLDLRGVREAGDGVAGEGDGGSGGREECDGGHLPECS